MHFIRAAIQHFESCVRLGTLICCLSLSTAAAFGQVGGDSIPSTIYFNSFGGYNNGDYRDALTSFQNEGRSGIRSAQNRWIDSICYHTMTGECYYQMGRLPEALAQYNAALKLYNQFSTWMIRVNFPAGIQPATGRVAQAPWGASKRGTRIGQFAETFPMSQGQIDNNNVIKQGGVVQNPKIFSIHAAEIVRCTALAIRHRRDIMGPAGKYDPLTAEVLAKLSGRPGAPNNWSAAWVDVQLGAAYASAGNMAQAIATLERSLVVGGEFDHPLTGTGLMELGRLALEAGDYDTAARLFEETTYSAYSYMDLALLEEAFRYGQLTHLMANHKGVYPPLASAIAWAKTKGYRQLHASLSLLAAENLAARSQMPQAVAMVGDAKATIGTSDLAKSAVGARLNHITALTAYAAGSVAAGDAALAAALAYQKTGSFWMYHITLADEMYTRSDVSDRVRMQMYESVLRDPTPADWLSSPLESLSVLVTPHPLSIEHWFEVAVRRKENETALEIADRLRRHRFLSTLPMGGRLTSLRWVLEGPTELLGEQGALQRQDLLVRYPKYEELAAEAKKLKVKLAANPPAPEASDARREQAKDLNALASIGLAQEAILREMAVRREPAEIVFPPLRKTKDVQAAVPEGSLLLAFFSTSRDTHAFLFSRDKYASWRIASPTQLLKHTTTLLRDMGCFDQNHQVTSADLTKAAWNKSAAKVMDLLFEKSNVDLDKFEELIIVPDGLLWHLPFEALPLGKKDAARPLIAKARVRYAPTVGLAIPYAKPRSDTHVGVMVGKLYPQDDVAVAQGAFEKLSAAVPGAVALPSMLQAPSSVYRSLFDELIVLDDIEPADAGPYEWSPAQVDRGKAGSSLASWFPLPWGGPERVILPGFHTAAENAFKKKNSTGNELFLAVCGLMSTGTRTVLISRWRTGGQISFDLVREFAQELPHTSPADAWQRAVLVARDEPIEPEGEPRVKKFPADFAPPKAESPFFWAGYMLVDSGVPSDKPDAPAAPPALNFDNKKKPMPAAKPGAPAGNAPAAKVPGRAAVPAAMADDVDNAEPEEDMDADDNTKVPAKGKGAKKAAGKSPAKPTKKPARAVKS